jgi:CubicO group peptidase (beta-lactamase class C family)
MKTIRVSIVSIALAVAMAAHAIAGDAPAAARDVSSILAPILEKHSIPGMAAAIVQGDRTVAIGAAGVRRAGGPEKITVDDRFHLGSCTKSMTATLCALLVEEKKLDWTTTVGDVFPDLRERMRPSWRGVTLEQLLTHRGGAPADLADGGLWARLWAFAGPPTAARRTLLEGVVGREPEAPPGTKWIYSNAGFAIAGHMAEQVTGRSWESLMTERLFAPLGMASAGFGAPGTAGVVDQPRGHSADGKPVEPGPGADNPVAIGPAGIVHASIGDWAKYVSLHLRGDEGDARLLKPETFAKLHAPAAGPPPSYAMGWTVADRDWAGGRVLTHNGSNTMWFCVTWLAPKRDFAVLVACNRGGDGGAKACDEASSALVQDELAALSSGKGSLGTNDGGRR